MKAIINTAPATEPLTVEDLHMHLRIDEDTGLESEYLQDIIVAARQYVEDLTGRALFTQTWDYYLDEFPEAKYIKIPFGNLQSVTHIKYTDSDGDETTMTIDTDYLVETNGKQCGRIVLPYGVSWPSTTLYTSNPIVIRFVAGWTTRALIPDNIKHAMKLICTDLYSNRESQIYNSYPGQTYEENKTALNLLRNQRLNDTFL